MGWNLFLDDLRDVSYVNDGKDYIVARSTQEAQNHIYLLGAPDYMSLDYDLGGTDTAEIFVKWLFNHLADQLEGNELPPCPQFRIHSDNGPGRTILDCYLKSWTKAYKDSYPTKR